MKSSEIKVSTVIRFHDIRHITYLERALHSLHAQTEVSVKPIIVLQRFSEEDQAEVEEMVSKNWYFDEHMDVSVVNFEDGEDFDARSHLINVGMQCHIESGNNFLGFLDYDDFLYSHAYSTLAQTLVTKKAAIAFGGIEMTQVVPFKDYDFVYEMSKPYAGRNKIDLLRDNFCPLHSYLLNTDIINKDELFFRENMSRVEDYEFLIRIVGVNPCDFSNLDHFIGCYVMRSDGSNTTPTGNGTLEDTIKSEVWKDNVKLLNKYKANTEVKFFASDF